MAGARKSANLPFLQAQYPTVDDRIEQEDSNFDFNKAMDGMDSLSVAEIEELQASDERYVLLLIDFSDFLTYRDSPVVGQKDMKDRIHDAVKHHMDKLDPSMNAPYRLVVCGYYDIEALAESIRDRVLKFAATLSAMDPYFDFIYVLGEAAVEQKILDLYSAATNDEKCKHILLAAWGRPLYLRILQVPNIKATIMEGSSMKPGIQVLPLALPIVELPHIFHVGDARHQLILLEPPKYFQ
ncbi:hypothetical protein N0V95_000643 [Ascochyta clinopodiicola]|nr:hypothetical protein N0V95_000643 [Ascochyta clinopodiicola]